MDDDFHSFLKRLRRHQRVIDRQLSRIALCIDQPSDEVRHSRHLWSEKECASSAIVKLSQMQTKWMELELQALRLLNDPVKKQTNDDALPLTEHELNLFAMAMQRWQPPMPMTILSDQAMTQPSMLHADGLQQSVEAVSFTEVTSENSHF
ncbi:MAG: hypothetical protein K2Q12_06625 [Rickettsiales bacterium]|nr:hypothetical protein [Rickettsiales bacterium]